MACVFDNALANLDVKKMTEVVIALARGRFDLRNKLDNDMFNHVVYVSNQSMMLLKKQGANWTTAEKIGKLFWRLFNVIQAYNSKRRSLTLGEILRIVSEFEAIFGG
jgi:hypothetical protein